MLQIQNCTLLHTKDGHYLMNKFSMTANPGDKIVLIGEEGNGKSTFLQWIYDPSYIQSYIEYHGQCIQTNEQLAYLPQQLPAKDQALTIYEFFCESEAFFDHQTDIGKYAKTLGSPADLAFSDQKMMTLSGGEKVKVQLLRFLLDEPTCILLDEPSNDLDIQTLEWLETWINAYPGILFCITHDETLIENTAHQILHFEQLKKKTQPKVSFCLKAIIPPIYKRVNGLLIVKNNKPKNNEKRKNNAMPSSNASNKKWNMPKTPLRVKMLMVVNY